MICCTGILANFFYERAGESDELADMLMACAACFLACTPPHTQPRTTAARPPLPNTGASHRRLPSPPLSAKPPAAQPSAAAQACTVVKDSRQELMQKEPVASKINNEAVDRDYPRLPEITRDCRAISPCRKM